MDPPPDCEFLAVNSLFFESNAGFVCLNEFNSFVPNGQQLFPVVNYDTLK